MFCQLLFWREENTRDVSSSFYSNHNRQSAVFVSSIQAIKNHWNVIPSSYSWSFLSHRLKHHLSFNFAYDTKWSWHFLIIFEKGHMKLSHTSQKTLLHCLINRVSATKTNFLATLSLISLINSIDSYLKFLL